MYTFKRLLIPTQAKQEIRSLSDFIGDYHNKYHVKCRAHYTEGDITENNTSITVRYCKVISVFVFRLKRYQ